MAIIKKKIVCQNLKYTSEPLTVCADWLKEFYRLCNGSAWNHVNNWWLNDQYKNGATPKEARNQCTIIEL